MRETADYRPNLESVRSAFGDRQWLKIKDVCGYLGLCYNTVRKRYPDVIRKRGCTQAELARLISK